MQTVIYLIFIIIIGLVGSAWSVKTALTYSINPSGLTVNNWRADPQSGSINADPYQKALTAISGGLPLDSNETVIFTRSSDDTGDALDLACTYRLGDTITNTRFWTLTLVNKDGETIKPNWDFEDSIYSQDLIFNHDNSFSLTISAQPHSGNWVPLKGEGEFKLVLHMYDTPIISSSEIFETKLPQVQKTWCKK